MAEDQVCVVLMTYGSPATLDEIPAYMRNVRGGRDPDAALVEEFRRRYSLIGGSPLVKITQAQASALQAELEHLADRNSYEVHVGMRFSPPFIGDVIRKNAPSSGAVVGVIMSPQYSPLIMGGYVRSLEEAVAGLGREHLLAAASGDWHLQPFFLEALAGRVTEALGRMPADVADTVPVLFTAHSMPRRVVDGEPGYIAQLEETSAAVAELVGLPEGRWMFCYQSAGHTPEEWLKPDFADMMPQLRGAGHANVLIAPIQFLADHLEVLYDIEIGAREQAERVGINFFRTESLNTSPLFIKALSEVVRETLARAKREEAITPRRDA